VQFKTYQLPRLYRVEINSYEFWMDRKMWEFVVAYCKDVQVFSLNICRKPRKI